MVIIDDEENWFRIEYGVLISPVAWVQFFVADVSFFNWPNLFLIAASNILVLVVLATEKLLGKP